MAVEWLMSKREAVEGVEPTLITGKPRAASKDEFRSTAEVVTAMKMNDMVKTLPIQKMLSRSCPFQRILRRQKMPRGKGTYGSSRPTKEEKEEGYVRCHTVKSMDSMKISD